MPRTPILLLLSLVCSSLFAATDDADVTIQKDVAYLAPERKEKADLYLPAERPPTQRSPAIVIIHGGGWTSGDKGASREINIGTTLAKNGYVAMSINYALATLHGAEPTWPQNLYDCKTAVRWLRKNADRLQIDVDHIGVIGGSAGGHLAAMLALTSSEPKLDPGTPYGEQSCKVKCAVDLYGPVLWFEQRDLTMFRKKRTEAPELYRQASPLAHIDAGDPPILIIHGTADGTVDLADSQALAAALAKAKVKHQLVVVEGGKHSFHLEPPQQDLRPIILAFFAEHLKPKP